MGFIIGFLF